MILDGAMARAEAGKPASPHPVVVTFTNFEIPNICFFPTKWIFVTVYREKRDQ